MLIVKTYIDKSPINHIGLFAGEFIPAGTKIWEFKEGFDREIPKSKLRDLNDIQKNFIKNYASFDGKNYCLVADNTRFINHAPDMFSSRHEQNTPYANVQDSDCLNYIESIVDIQKGEEILMDYELIEEGSSDFSQEENYSIK